MIRGGAGTRGWFSDRFELSRGGGAHIRPMEGLRGFATLLVFATHYIGFTKPFVDQSTGFAAVAKAVDTVGNSGVDLFFVLSGYLIYGSLIARPQAFAQFMQRRIVRIYPVFTVMFLVYVLLSVAFPGESKIPASLAGAAGFMLGIFFLLPGFFPMTWMIAVSWSLSYEMFYYTALPLVISAFTLRHRGVAWRILFFSVLAVGFAAYCAVYGGHVRLVMFVAGILLYEAIKHLRLRPPGGALTVLIVAAGLSAQALPLPGSAGDTLRVLALFVAFFSLCFCCFADPDSRVRRAFEWTPLRWFGNMSYSFYMVHALPMQFIALVVAAVIPASAETGPLLFWGLLPVMFAGALLPAVLLYLFVERPFSLKPRTAQGRAEGTQRPSQPLVPTPRATLPTAAPSRLGFSRRRLHSNKSNQRGDADRP